MQAVQSKDELNKERAELLAKKRRLRAMHAADACQCPKCFFPFLIHSNFSQWVDEKAETIRCGNCGHVYEAVDKTIAERDVTAGIRLFAVDFTGAERPCTRHPHRLEWLGGSVGAGVPIVVKYDQPSNNRPEKLLQQYVTWLVEALHERAVGRPLYRLVSARQAQ